MASSSNCNQKPSTVKNFPNKASSMPKLGNRRPVVLSSTRYQKLMLNATKTQADRAQQEAEEEDKYREYLKKGSEKLVANFTGPLQRTQEQKMVAAKAGLEEKNQKIKDNFHKYKENEKKVRREKIAKATQLVEKLKPGPRELQSAALQSEILRARNIQMDINAKYQSAVKQQECLNMKTCQKQNGLMAEDEQTRAAARKQSNNQYKNELLQTINKNKQNRVDNKKKLIREQVLERERVDHEIKTQIEREMAIMEKKRTLLRQNALEAMKMVEQRRLRDTMADEVEGRLCCVYNEGKNKLNQMLAEQNKKTADERTEQYERNAKVLVSQQTNVEQIEEERVRRDISRMQLQFTADEREKVRREKMAKQARIEAYIREMERQKLAKLHETEMKRYDMAQRFKNSEVNCMYEQGQRQERFRKQMEMRQIWKEQAEEKKRALEAEKLAYRSCYDNRHEKDHKFFFDYAYNLMHDAHKKKRPLYPFGKAVQQYKHDNQIEWYPKTPKHLISNVDVGGQGRNAQHAMPKASISSAPSKDNIQKQIRQKSLKIDALLAIESTDADKACEPICPIGCFNHEPRPSKSAGDCADAKSTTASIRYSVEDLKKLNQYEY